MIGNFWSTGITLKYDGRGKWWASAKWKDDGHAQDGSAWLNMGTSYAMPIELALDTLLLDAEKMGLCFCKVAAIQAPGLYIESEEAPDDWREILQEQAARIGWSTYG